MSDTKKQIYKPQSISGFPEWIPEIRLIEQQWLDHIRRVFESYGYTSVETPSVEELDVLLAKGETDKEIYTLTRLQANPEDKKDTRLGLHFDQTVPFARYSAQHFNDLVFPFKRYQMQRVWRGERPQLGRSREFTQCDIDVINVDHLPMHFDAEMPAVLFEALDGLDIGKFQIQISNRKILLGLLQSMDIKNPYSVTRIIDKNDKISRDDITKLLQTECNLSLPNINAIITLVSTSDIDTITPCNESMEEGLTELQFVMGQLSHLPIHAVKADLSIIRGFDYYTGTVYEAKLLDIPEFTRSIGGGGRYDDLAGSYINRKLPGVGISIGFTCLFEVLHHYGYIKGRKKSPADILMILPSEDQRSQVSEFSRMLRERGFKIEQYHLPQKLKKQLSYAEKKGIPYVWFPPSSHGETHAVKSMESGQQIDTTIENWNVEQFGDNA